MNDEDPKLRTKDAAAYVNVSESSLSQMRYRGRGPAYIRLGPRTVVYRRSVLDAWMAANTVQPRGAA